MPLAGDPGRVPRLAEAAGDRVLLVREAGTRVEVVGARRVELVAEPRLVPAGHEARAGGAAVRGGHVPVREPDAGRGQRVDVRRGDLGVPLDPERSLVVTSNTGFKGWERFFPSKAHAIATIDRLMDRATILRFTGKTMRDPKDSYGDALEDDGE